VLEGESLQLAAVNVGGLEELDNELNRSERMKNAVTVLVLRRKSGWQHSPEKNERLDNRAQHHGAHVSYTSVKLVVG
jgi:hypothetical protein